MIGFCLTTSSHKFNFRAYHAHHTHNAQNWSVETLSDFRLDLPLGCITCFLAFRRFSSPLNMGKCLPLILGGTSFYPQLRYFHFKCYMTCFWPPLPEVARQLCTYHFVNFRISTTYYSSPNSNLLNPSLVVTLRCSVPVSFLLLG